MTTDSATNLPDWAKKWTAGTFDHNPEGIEWMRSRPESIKKLMLRFPPSCIVVPLRPLHTPRRFGIVRSYKEETFSKTTLVNVYEGPDGEIGADCQPDWIEPIAFWRGLTPELVTEILK